jgi:phosphatidylglycerophosphate synthase
MTLYKNRRIVDGLSRRVGKTFSFLPANAWTAISILFVFMSFYFLLEKSFLASALFFAIASFLDVIDGGVARYRKEASPIGAYLDTIVDRYIEGIMAIGLLIIVLPAFYLPSYVWAAIYLFGSGMVTYAKAAAKEKLNKEVKGGLMERPERLLLLIAGLVAAYFSPLYLTYAIIALAILTNLTALQRIRTAFRKGL